MRGASGYPQLNLHISGRGIQNNNNNGNKKCSQSKKEIAINYMHRIFMAELICKIKILAKL